MKTTSASFIRTLLIAVLFVSLFWSEKMGINVLLFTLLSLPLVGLEFPGAVRNNKVKVMMGLTIIAATLVVWHNSILSKIIFCSSFAGMMGFVHQTKLISIYQAILLPLINLLTGPFYAADLFRTAPIPQFWRKWRINKVLASVLPVGVISLFYFIYYVANPHFAELSDQFWSQFNWFGQIQISWPFVFYCFSALLLAFSMIFPSRIDEFFGLFSKEESLKRKRSAKKRKRGMLILKDQLYSGQVLLIALNALLLIVNSLDIWYIWLGKENISPSILSSYVHEGTYILILAILLGISVSIYYFWNNINFISGNRRLKRLAYLWLIQNALLALSVMMRNVHYIDFYGLAYKRVGVMVFLSMVFMGLYTVYYKIQFRKNFRFLIEKNAWAVFTILFLTSFINWDLFMTQYNLHTHQGNPIDIHFLMEEVSDKNLFVLEKNKELVKEKLSESGRMHQIEWFESNLKYRKERFKAQNQEFSFLSWNYADHRNKAVINAQ